MYFLVHFALYLTCLAIARHAFFGEAALVGAPLTEQNISNIRRKKPWQKRIS
jgi:hypothetical protein